MIENPEKPQPRTTPLREFLYNAPYDVFKSILVFRCFTKGFTLITHCLNYPNYSIYGAVEAQPAIS